MTVESEPKAEPIGPWRALSEEGQTFQTLDQAGIDWKERQKEMQETGRLMRRHLQEARVGS